MRTSILGALLAASLLAACKGADLSAAGDGSSARRCVACHGEGDSSAPPRTTKGATATTELGVGAHAAHVNPGPFRKAFACSECHPVPKVASDPPHGDGQVDVTFGAVAASGGARPRWDAAAATCSGTYCHGATLHDGTRTAPVWTNVVRDVSSSRSEVYCGACHGIPPATGDHPAVDAAVPGYAGRPDPAAPATLAVCSACHPDTVGADGQVDVAGGRHVDGVLQLGAFACAQCHGDAADASRPLALRPAPPGGMHGERATSDRAVGAHAVHLQGTDLAATPVACAECHAVPTSMLSHPNPAYTDASRVVDLSWGPLATAGGAAPAWDPASLSCASTYCHGSTLRGGTATAPVWTKVDGSQRTCASCHGVPPPTPAHAQDAQANPDPGDCDHCHAGYSRTAVVKETHLDGLVNVTNPDDPNGARTCTSCHGDSSRAPGFLRPAPPTSLDRSTSTTTPGVGAHLAHLTGNHLSAAPVACGECHPPETRTDHAARNGYALQLVWGPRAKVGPSYPEYDAQNLTCRNTYCHGSTLTGGSRTAPVWNDVTGDPALPTSQVACGSCHGIPPPAPHTDEGDCGTCHTGYTSRSVNLALHLDGQVEAAGAGCSTCHGDPSRTPATLAAAPPVEARPASGTAPWAGDGASGTHLRHLRAGPLSRAFACGECHTVPPDAPKGGGDTHGDGQATLAFGRLAAAAGATPAFDPTRATCSNTYCHGSTLAGGSLTTPVWTRADGSQVACGTCHGVPPSDAAHAAVSNGVSCGDCHSGYGGAKGGAAGTFTVNTALHVNGLVEATGGSCTSCHGTAGRRLVAGADAQTPSAPPADAKGFTAAGAHLAHLNRGTLSRPVACGACHAVPTAAPEGGADAHGDGKATVAFGPLAKADGASPTFASGSCASTYCHGGTLAGGAVRSAVWARTDGTETACTACHGMPPPSPHPAGTSCGSCHPGYGDRTVAVDTHIDGKIESKDLSCTSCHGDASRTPSAIAPAPPAEAAAPSGGTAPWAGDGAQGAHLAHLVAGPLGKAYACTECHTVPATAPKGGGDAHGDGKATLAFGAASRTKGASPQWNAASVTCSGTYCHGATLAGGSATAPVWTRTDGTQAACTSCHGMPPPDALHDGLASGSACSGCHTGYGGTKGGTAFTINRSIHLNGAVDATGGTCTSCHGTAGRSLVTGADAQTASAPPANARGFSVAGAHLAHLNKGSGAIGKKLACGECHSVPSSSPKGGTDTHGDGQATVRFGNLSRAGGRNPSFNGGTLTCASTYCHGNAQPRWSDGGPLSCTACHANPPNDACHTFRHEASGGRCNGCHRNVSSSGTSLSNPAQHVDGVIQGQCSDCHRGNLSCTNTGDDD